MRGVADEIGGDFLAVTVKGLDMEGQKMEIPARNVRKRFKPGDHTKATAGQNADETGLVVLISDNVVTSMQEVC